jgi:hypothetical protein
MRRTDRIKTLSPIRLTEDEYKHFQFVADKFYKGNISECIRTTMNDLYNYATSDIIEQEGGAKDE